MASDLNSVALVGRLTRDAELSYLPSGMPVAAMSIAVNRSRKENDQWVSEVNYFDISYFSKSAESVKPYLTKGKQIAVQGSLKQDRWEKDGQKFSKVRIMANSVELLGSRSDGGGAGYSGSGAPGGYQQRSGYAASAPQQESAPPEGDAFGGGGQDFPEDIPF
ncbi:MAG TPA: single-stranded DNA-binding protein [Treponema sp.]|nr:single-stranded DNA-binding protein [Treponema sp.]